MMRMINANEHKKLLAQITELEKKSVNYFDVEKEFFLIDSNNLSQVRPQLYGYSIQRSGIYEDDNLTLEAIAGLDGRGFYIYVDVQDGKITIKQDLNGAWGIYLFRHGDYFALSNSFFRLLDHVKFRYRLTVNRDYFNQLFVNDLCSHAYLETAVNEIKLIDRNAIMNIDILSKELQIELINYKENSVPLDSEEGIAILDHWVEFWSSVFRGVAQHTNFISADLSGGFDTRINFVPLLHSGVDLNKMLIYLTREDSNPILGEDHYVASKIAEHYGFKLNQSLPAHQSLNYSLKDIWNADLYSQQTFRNVPTVFVSRKSVDKIYHLPGNAGGLFRKNCHMQPQKFIANKCESAKQYSRSLAQELTNSIQTVIKSGFSSVCDKYQIKDPNSIDIPQYFYRETIIRNHCGKANLAAYLRNVVEIVPAYDPEMQTLQLKTSKCPDYNLLMVLLFTRYAPDLLKIPFDIFHGEVDLETLIPEAQKINERFPLVKKNNPVTAEGEIFHLPSRDTQTEKILSLGRNNPAIPEGLPETCLKATFESSRTYGLFTSNFDEELYNYAANYYDTHDFNRDRSMYAIVSAVKVLEDVQLSQRNYPQYQDMKRFLDQDFAIIHRDDQTLFKFKNYFTARIDIKFLSTEGDFQILSISDDKATIWKPAWLQKGGIGYQIQSYVGKLEMVAKSTVNGKINLELRGLDVKDSKDKSKRIPYWVDYTKLTVNGKTILNKNTPAWHDKAYLHRMDVKAGEEIKIQVEWLPHRGDILPEAPKVQVKTIADKFLPYVTGRVDIQLVPKTAGSDFKILSVSDERASVDKAEWLQKDGIGYQIQSYAGNMDIIAKATADGQIRLNLRGLDVRDPKDKSKRIPYWIDYTKLAVNGKVIINKRTPAWHDKAYYHAIDVKAGEEIKVQVEWLPHRSNG